MFEPTTVDRFRRQLASMIAAAGTPTEKGDQGGGDPEALAQVLALLDEARAVMVPQAVQALRDADGPAGGYSWADIARPLGITRQSAAERFGR